MVSFFYPLEIFDYLHVYRWIKTITNMLDTMITAHNDAS